MVIYITPYDTKKRHHGKSFLYKISQIPQMSKAPKEIFCVSTENPRYTVYYKDRKYFLSENSPNISKTQKFSTKYFKFPTASHPEKENLPRKRKFIHNFHNPEKIVLCLD